MIKIKILKIQGGKENLLPAVRYGWEEVHFQYC